LGLDEPGRFDVEGHSDELDEGEAALFEKTAGLGFLTSIQQRQVNMVDVVVRV
jgi:hypothetical protein